MRSADSRPASKLKSRLAMLGMLVAVILGVTAGHLFDQGAPVDSFARDTTSPTSTSAPAAQPIVVSRVMPSSDAAQYQTVDVPRSVLEEADDEPAPRSEADVEAELELAFQTDGQPGEAARTIESKLRDAFGGEGAHLTSLECRLSTCRLEVSFDDSETSENTIRGFFLSGNYDLDLAATVASRDLASDGSMHVRVYLYPDRPSREDVEGGG